MSTANECLLSLMKKPAFSTEAHKNCPSPQPQAPFICVTVRGERHVWEREGMRVVIHKEEEKKRYKKHSGRFDSGNYLTDYAG